VTLSSLVLKPLALVSGRPQDRSYRNPLSTWIDIAAKNNTNYNMYVLQTKDDNMHGKVKNPSSQNRR